MKNLKFALSLVTVAWIVQVINMILGYQLNAFGIRPGESSGLIGIVFAPFLHGSWGHLIANTVPSLVLITMVCWSGRRVFWQSSLIIMLVAGAGTWLIGGVGTSHVGSSGMIYGWVAFLIARGLFTWRLSQLFVGIIVFLLYGSLWVGVLPTHQAISWQGHLCGAIAGVIAAWLLPKIPRAKRKATRVAMMSSGLS